MDTNGSLATILKREMMETETSLVDEEATAAKICIPNPEVDVLEVTMDSLGGEEDIKIQAIQRKEQLVILGDQSKPIPNG